MARKRRLPRRNAKGRFIKASANPRRRRARSTTRRRTRRAAARSRVVVVNPRRRRSPVRRRRRTYRRNPVGAFKKFMSMPTLKAVGFTLVGVTGTPFASGFVLNLLPETFKTGQTGRYVGYGVKILSAWGVGRLTQQFFGRDAGRAAYIGGAAYVALDLIRDFFPNILPPTSMGRYLGKYMGAQPLLGAYPSSGMGAYSTQGIPNRLQPSDRF